MMRVIVVAALTADGFIARDHHSGADWTSKEDKKTFVRLTKEAGVMVMGGNTYRTIGRPLPGRRNLVYSRSPIDQEGIEVVSESPAELAARLESEGHTTLAVIGGQAIYDLFLQAGLVTDLYLTIEPVLFGTGLTPFASSADVRLKLVSQEHINDNALLLHYEVQR